MKSLPLCYQSYLTECGRRSYMIDSGRRASDSGLYMEEFAAEGGSSASVCLQSNLTECGRRSYMTCIFA